MQKFFVADCCLESMATATTEIWHILLEEIVYDVQQWDAMVCLEIHYAVMALCLFDLST